MDYKTESPVQIEISVPMPTRYGMAELITFSGLNDGKEHVALAFGDWEKVQTPSVRIHSECLTGDVFGSKRCDCGPQLEEAMSRFSRSSGIVLYLRQEGRGIGLNNKIKAYALQDLGLNTYEANRRLGFEADERDFEIAAEMLKALGIHQIHLLSNNPRKRQHLENFGISVRQRLFTQTYICEHNHSYLSAKAGEGGHDGLLCFQTEVAK